MVVGVALPARRDKSGAGFVMMGTAVLYASGLLQGFAYAGQRAIVGMWDVLVGFTCLVA